jgi:lysine-N-methylase
MAADSPSHSDSTIVSGESRARMAPPTYAAAFRCIGASCEDTCCGNWDIPVDRSTYGKYQQFPSEKLGSLVSQFVSINIPEQAHSLYARISMGPSGSCPFFGDDHLCAIQKVHGPQLLSSTCSIYPRSLSRVAGKLEGSLSLSSPEAARFVLLAPDALRIEGNLFSGDFRTDNVFHPAGDPRCFLDIRALVIDLVRDRARPMWQRLLLIGSLCKRLDEIEDVIPEILRDCRRIVETQVVHGELESMPSQPRLKLEVIFALTDARVRDPSTGRRFHDVFWTFVAGIASPEKSRSRDDVERFLQAEEDYHRPFFERSPFILENYLVNYIFQNLFPYGREGSADFTPRSMFDEYVQMTTQFAWINALLIGVAGHYKRAFSEEHVVQTIQSFARSVEHYPDVLQSITEYICSRGLDSLQGMAILLKN